jgi:ribosomal protein L11 methyltransferase
MSGGGGAKGERFVWRKLSPAKWEDVWQERLGWLGQRLVLFMLKGYKTLRIEAHQVTKAEADGLKREFGGDVRAAKPLTAADLEPQRRPPLKIGRRLAVIGQEEDRAAFDQSGIPAILIPASMAFGTGDHATTATCLRILADVAKVLESGAWEALDLGTGTGILAMAARLLGARKVEAADFDPTAVRVARENAKVNKITRIAFKRFDVRTWRPERKWDVVLANVYGPILIEAAPQIARAVVPGGTLIISGILREQADDVLVAFQQNGCNFNRVARKGKWVTACAVREPERKKPDTRRRSRA